MWNPVCLLLSHKTIDSDSSGQTSLWFESRVIPMLSVYHHHCVTDSLLVVSLTNCCHILVWSD